MKFQGLNIDLERSSTPAGLAFLFEFQSKGDDLTRVLDQQLVYIANAGTQSPVQSTETAGKMVLAATMKVQSYALPSLPFPTRPYHADARPYGFFPFKYLTASAFLVPVVILLGLFLLRL